MDHHDDMYSLIREVGRYRMREAHHDMYIDGQHHHNMYVGVKFKFEKLHAFSPF